MDSDPFSANATSQLSSDFKSAISTSPLEQSLHNTSRLERGHSACLPSTLSGSVKRQRSNELPSGPRLEEVFPIWLEASAKERYLLLEDADTGDILMPLIYMKAVFEANYSRKLSSLKNRLVVMPADQDLPEPRPSTYMYWQWAFESPQNVKLLVRQELGEENAPQGHLRLVLLPIVYNAMAAKENLRKLPLFRALERAMRASTYGVLVRHPAQQPPPAATSASDPLINTPPQPSGGGCGEAGMPELPAEQQPQREGTPQDSCQPAAQRLFTGPRSIEATAAKYMISYKEAEETDHSIKRTRMVQSSSQRELGAGTHLQGHHHKQRAVQSSMSDHTAATDLRREFREFKRRMQDEISSMNGELAIVKNCIMQLYNVLLPGKFAAVGSHVPPAAPAAAPVQRTPPLPHPPHQHPAYAQGAHTSMSGVPGRAYSPAHALTTPPPLRSSRSVESLVSTGVPAGVNPCGEGSLDSQNSPPGGVPQRPASGHLSGMGGVPHLHLQQQLQLTGGGGHPGGPPSGPPIENLNSFQGLPAPYGPPNPSQPMNAQNFVPHPSLQGPLGSSGAALGLHMQQLSTTQHMHSHHHREALENLAAARLLPQGPFAQLADRISAPLPVPLPVAMTQWR